MPPFLVWPEVRQGAVERKKAPEPAAQSVVLPAGTWITFGKEARHMKPMKPFGHHASKRIASFGCPPESSPRATAK